MAFWKRSLAGPGYIILNTIRVMNIISLLAVVAASFVMLVKTFVVSQFYFFDGVSHVITATLGIFLIISELPFFRNYFSRNWPLLSLSSGFVTLGILMIIVGVSILGNLNKAATSEQNLGLSFWQIVISSGIVICILGFVNIVASYVFRTKSQGVTARMVRAYGAVAPQKVSDILSNSPSTRSPRRSFQLGRSDTLPSYHTSSNNLTQPAPQMQRSNTINTQVTRSSSGIYRPSPDTYRSMAPPMTRASSVYSQGSARPVTRMGLNISAPVSEDQEQFAKFKGSEDVRRPDLAAHPAWSGGRI
ncbi:hypothetical protein MMC19_004719 [Ptychographa xylographoides]|nr:hypothetical protein [Ptychographa xylographoides]